MGYRLISSSEQGFTLFELIAVIAVIGISLFFVVPKFQEIALLNESKKLSRWIIQIVPSLKEKSLREQKTYILHADIEEGGFWISEEGMSEEQLAEARKSPVYKLSDDLKITGVKYPVKGMVSAGDAEIRFNKAGYSDKVIIYLKDDDKEISFLIESFLSKVKRYDGYADFEG